MVQKWWERINTICFINYTSCSDFKHLLIVIPIEVAEKIICYNAQFCNNVFDVSYSDDVAIAFGPFYYNVKNFTFDRAFQLLIENGKEMRLLETKVPPKIESLQHLFKTNKIKEVRMRACSQFWLHIPTDGIEDLKINCIKSD